MTECFMCDGTGVYKCPKNQKEYEEIFDRYDAQGNLDMRECREKALYEVGYDLVECPACKGTGEKSDC